MSPTSWTLMLVSNVALAVYIVKCMGYVVVVMGYLATCTTVVRAWIVLSVTSQTCSCWNLVGEIWTPLMWGVSGTHRRLPTQIQDTPERSSLLIGLGRYKKAEVRSKGGLGIFAYTTNVIWTQISDRKWIGNGKDSWCTMGGNQSVQ